MEAGALVRAVLAPIAADKESAQPNFSVRLAPASDGVAQELHTLYRARALAARSRRPSRVVRALVAALSDVAARQDGSIVCLDMLPVVAASGAVLLPRSLVGRMLALENRLNQQGCSLVDGELACLDTTTGELVVGHRSFEVDEALIDALDDHFPCRPGGAEAAPPGRYPVVGLVTPAPLAEESPLATLTQLLPLVVNSREVGPDAVLDTLTELARGARCAGPALSDDAALLQLLVGLARV